MNNNLSTLFLKKIPKIDKMYYSSLVMLDLDKFHACIEI